MQFCREYFCQTCSASVTSPEEDMDTGMGSCIGVQRSQATAYTESQTGETRDGKPENGAVLTGPPPTPPEQGALRTSSGDEGSSREEETLFTDDLLPNIDLTSELSLWGSSFGTQARAGEMKSEQVTFSSSPNPLLAGLRHYAEASPPAVVIVKSPVPDTSSCAGDTDLRPRPQIPPDAHPGAPPDLPLQSPLTLVDRELQEAFQECEEHMASLLVPRPAAAAPPNDEADRRLSVPPPEGEDVGPLKNKSATGGSELSALPPGALTNQDRGEPNSGTQTAEPLTAKREVETFSFRDYILGLTGEGEEGEIAGKQVPSDPLDTETDIFTDAQTHVLMGVVKTQEEMTQESQPDVPAGLLEKGLNDTEHDKPKESEKETGSQIEAEKTQSETLRTDTQETTDLSKETTKDTKGMKLTATQEGTKTERQETGTDSLKGALNNSDVFNQTDTQTQLDLLTGTMPPGQTLNETPTEAVPKPPSDTTGQTHGDANPEMLTEPEAAQLKESRDRSPVELQISTQHCRAVKMEAERGWVRESQDEAATALTGAHAESETGLQTQADTQEGLDAHTDAPAVLKSQAELQPLAGVRIGCDLPADTQPDLKKQADLLTKIDEGAHVNTPAPDLKIQTEMQAGQGTCSGEVADLKRQIELQTQADTPTGQGAPTDTKAKDLKILTELQIQTGTQSEAGMGTQSEAGMSTQIDTQVQDLETPIKMVLQAPVDTHIKMQMEIKEESHTGCSGFQEQLRQQGEPHICPPVPDPESGQDRITVPGSPPAPAPAPDPPLPPGPQQPPAGSRTGGPHPPVTAPETPHQAATEGQKNDKNAPATSVTVVEIDRSREGGGGERPVGKAGLRRGGGRP
ncbi:uncharacterized protein LOC133118580 [Conger conger]|uniref:uncharacterized protein LOC133118580 n=1 Tax=Conger conger TaxID=82655 RepID=UPI002A5AF6C8|nr:uncharacterized protein LOC133118580 [Conger conger]